MTKIHVLIPSFNCAKWIDRCLDSVKMQSVKPHQVLVIDDCSTERASSDAAYEAATSKGYSFLRNSENKKCPYNLWLGHRILNPDPDDVIFLLDGDDFLPHKNVFSRYQEVYRNKDTWMTYGNYRPHPHDTGQTLATAYPPEVIADRDFRTAGNLFNHPITFRSFLFDAIPEADMKNKHGRWFRGGYDYAIIIPMLEMAGGEHYEFLDENLYSYNAVNPISDSKVNVKLIQETDQLRFRPKKDLLIR